MVPSRPKSKVYNCFIKLSGILHEIDFNNKETSMALSAASKNRREMRCVYCDVIRKCTPNSSVWAKNWRVNLRFRCDITETPNRPSLSICGVLTLRYGRGKHVSANHEEAKLDKLPDHLIMLIKSYLNWYIYLSSKKQKYRGMFETQKSGNKTCSGEIGLNIRTLASPKVGQDQVSGGVSVLIWYVAPVANVLWKPLAIR